MLQQSDLFEDHIDLQKVRSFSEMLGDTFGFIRQEFKPLSRAILMVAGPLLLTALLLALLGSGVDLFADPDSAVSEYNPVTGNYDVRLLSTEQLALKRLANAASILIGMGGIYLLFAVIMQYCRLYNEFGPGGFELADVRRAVRGDRGRTLLAMLVAYALLGIGWLACWIPGIYLSVPMTLLVMVYGLEPETRFAGAFSEGFTLSKKRWLPSFGVLAVLNVLVYTAFMAVIFGAFFVVAFFDKVGVAVGVNDSLALVIITLIGGIVFFVGMSLNVVGNVILYYSNREYHFDWSMVDKVESLDNDEAEDLPNSMTNYPDAFAAANAAAPDLTNPSTPKHSSIDSGVVGSADTDSAADTPQSPDSSHAAGDVERWQRRSATPQTSGAAESPTANDRSQDSTAGSGSNEPENKDHLSSDRENDEPPANKSKGSNPQDSF